MPLFIIHSAGLGSSPPCSVNIRKCISTKQFSWVWKLSYNTMKFLVILTVTVGLVWAFDESLIDHQIADRRVIVFLKPANWFRASEVCRRRGMQLLTIKSAQENFEVVELGNVYKLEWVWTAATDLAERRQWVWSTDGQYVRNMFWRDGEPSTSSERCMEAQMTGFPSNWNDNDCRRLRPFMCQEVADGIEDDEEEDEDDSDMDEYDYK